MSSTVKTVNMSNTTNQILLGLFSGNHAQVSSWLDETQARMDVVKEESDKQVFMLPSNPCIQNNRDTLIQLCESVKRAGFAVYSMTDTPENIPAAVSRLLLSLGLHGGDSGVIRDEGQLSLLHDASGTPKGRFPPYQSKAMNWHTDGYYNAPEDRVRCFTLHCVEPAAEGGALLLMDDAFLVLALLRDNPELVALLSHPEAMTLPRNRDNQGHDRPDRSVPMIAANTDGSVSMRFTTRSENIRWQCAATKAAAHRATQLIERHVECHGRLMLKKGQGVITRNILHAREQFVDSPGKPKRQILRGRFNSLPTPVESTYAAR